MASFVAKLGGFDFSDYCRVNPADGMAPYGQPYVDPLFGSAPGGEGQITLGTEVKNREHVYPIYFKSANKALLHLLIQQFNRETARISTEGALVHEWRDAGATASTFWDVSFARFEPDFNFRQSEKGYAAGIIRIWSQPPYGYSPTAPQMLASVAGASGLQVATVSAASLFGDVSGLAQVQVWSSPTQMVPAGGRSILVGALPNASYTPFIPPASMVAMLGATRVAASGAPASQMIIDGAQTAVFGRAHPLARFALQGPIYAGRHRVIAAVHPGEISGAAFSLLDGGGAPIGPTAVVQGAAFIRDPYQFADLGVITVSSAVPTQGFMVKHGHLHDSHTLAYDDSGRFGTRQGTSLYGGGLAGLYVVPEDQAALYVDEIAEVTAKAAFIASGQPTYGAGTWTIPDDMGNELRVFSTAGLGIDYDSDMFSNPGLYIASAMPGLQQFNVYATSVERSIDFRARGVMHAFNNGSIPTAMRYGVGKSDAYGDVIGVIGYHPTFPYLEVRAQVPALSGGVAATAFSRVYLTTPGSWMSQPTQQALHLEVTQRGDRAWANMRVGHASYWGPSQGIYSTGTVAGATYTGMACVGIQASWLEGILGYPQMELFGGSGAANPFKVVYWEHAKLTGPAAPSDNYLLDAVNDQVIVTTASYGSFDRSVGIRGRIPQVSPSGGRFVVAGAYVDGGPMNDLLTAALSVRDRFGHAR